MTDKKISELTGASTPLAGTEVLPVVQSGSTKKVATDDLTVKNIRSNATTGILQVAGPAVGATRVMTTPDANFTVARTDAAQTFVSGQIVDAAAPGTTVDVLQVVNSSAAIPGTSSRIWLSGRGGPAISRGSYVEAYLMGSGSPHDIIFGTNAAFGSPREVARISSAGDISCTLGNFVVGTAGKGIDFSANTNAAGMTSELLTRYEEGTATPILTDGTNNATLASGSTMFYTRIGRIVMVQGYIEVSNIGSVSGALRLAGLPFNVNVDSRSAFSVGQSGGLAITAGQSVTGFGQANTDYIRLYVWTATTGSTAMTNTQLPTNGFMSFAFNYVVA